MLGLILISTVPEIIITIILITDKVTGAQQS